MKIIVFTSKNCHSCHPHFLNIKKVVEERFPQVQVEEHPVEKYPEEATKFWIRSTPTAIAFEREKPVNTMIGAYPPREIEKWIIESLGLTGERK